MRVIIRSGVVIGARGAEDLEGYTGRQVRDNGGSTNTFTTSLLPQIRHGRTSRALVSVSNYYVIDDSIYVILSDMWEVPPGHAFDTGDWPMGVTIIVTQEPGSYIVGEGGYSSMHAGARGTGKDRVCLSIASDGGHALRIRYPVTWNNLGTIAGGGGGGFTGLFGLWNSAGMATDTVFRFIPSGGGAGRWSSPALPFDNRRNIATLSMTTEREASAGSLTSGGSGGVVKAIFRHGRNASNPHRATAGAGGALAQSGAKDTVVRLDNKGAALLARAYYGGRPGYAISEGADMITWVNKGIVLGQEFN